MGDVWGLLVDPVLVGVSWGPPDPAELAEVRLEDMVSLPRRDEGGVAVGFRGGRTSLPRPVGVVLVTSRSC